MRTAEIALFGILCVGGVSGDTVGPTLENAHQAQIAKDYETALRDYRTVVAKMRGSTGTVPSRVWFEIGVCERAIGSHEKAVEAFQKAIDADTHHQESIVWMARLRKARSLEDLGRSKEADATLEDCANELDVEATKGGTVKWKLDRLVVTQELVKKRRASKQSKTPNKTQQSKPR